MWSSMFRPIYAIRVPTPVPSNGVPLSVTVALFFFSSWHNSRLSSIYFIWNSIQRKNIPKVCSVLKLRFRFMKIHACCETQFFIVNRFSTTSFSRLESYKKLMLSLVKKLSSPIKIWLSFVFFITASRRAFVSILWSGDPTGYWWEIWSSKIIIFPAVVPCF